MVSLVRTFHSHRLRSNESDQNGTGNDRVDFATPSSDSLKLSLASMAIAFALCGLNSSTSAAAEDTADEVPEAPTNSAPSNQSDEAEPMPPAVTAPDDRYDLELLSPMGRIREIDGVVTFQWRVKPAPTSVGLTVYRVGAKRRIPVLKRDFIGSQNSFSVSADTFRQGPYEWELGIFDDGTGRVISKSQQSFSVEAMSRGYMTAPRFGFQFGLDRSTVQTQTSLASATTSLQNTYIGANAEWPFSERFGLGLHYLSRNGVVQGELLDSSDIDLTATYWLTRLNRKLRYALLAGVRQAEFHSVIATSATETAVKKTSVTIAQAGLGARYQINNELAMSGRLMGASQIDRMFQPTYSLLTKGQGKLIWTRLWPIELGLGIESFYEKVALGDLINASYGRDVFTTRSGFGVTFDVTYLFNERSDRPERTP